MSRSAASILPSLSRRSRPPRGHSSRQRLIVASSWMFPSLMCCPTSFLSARRSPRRRTASLVGPLRPGRQECELGRRWSFGRSLSEAEDHSHPAPSLIAASGRRTRRRGFLFGSSHRQSPETPALHGSGPVRGHAPTMPMKRECFCARGPERRPGSDSSRPGRRVPPRAMTAAPGGSSAPTASPRARETFDTAH